MGLLTVGFRGWRDKSQLSVAMMPRRFRRLFIRILTKWCIMFSTRLWKGPLKRMYEQPDTPKFKTRSPALRSATTEVGENIWDVGVRSVWLTSLGAVFPNFLFHGGTGKISFLTSENEKKNRFFWGDIWNLSPYFRLFIYLLIYLFVYLFIYLLNYCHRVTTQLQLNISYHLFIYPFHDLSRSPWRCSGTLSGWGTLP